MADEEDRFQKAARQTAELLHRRPPTAPIQSERPSEKAVPNPTTEAAAPMPPRDRRFWVTLAIWAAIPVGLFLAGVGPFVSGSPHWGVGLGLPGLVGAYFVTLHLLERWPHKPPDPSPLLIVIAILTWAFIGWQTWLWFHTPTQSYTAEYTADGWMPSIAAAQKFGSSTLVKNYQAHPDDPNQLRPLCDDLRDQLRDGKLLAVGFAFSPGSQPGSAPIVATSATYLRPSQGEHLIIQRGLECSLATDAASLERGYQDLMIRDNK
jgi:hypothetical protein